MQIEKLTFDYMFSYGKGNSIDFTENKVTLVEGQVGAGKSSIPTILEELLYNKNSRDFKKTEILNNRLDSKYYSGTVTFKINGDQYHLSKEVKTSAKVILTKNGIDISGHTATTTYKLLEEIIGLDFTTFSKLVYQSVKSQMDFLSATDAKRKEFLVGLMNLEQYKVIEDKIKEDKKLLDNELSALNGSINILEAQIKKFKDRELLVEKELPTLIDLASVRERIIELQNKLAIITSERNRYATKLSDYNKQVLEIQNRISKNTLTVRKHSDELERQCKLLEQLQQKDLPQPLPYDSLDLQKVTHELTEKQTLMSEAKKRYDHFRQDASKTSCHVCGSSLDKQASYNAALLAKDEYLALKPAVEELEKEKSRLFELQTQHKEYDSWIKQLDIAEKAVDKLKTDDNFKAITEQLKTDDQLLEELISNKPEQALIDDSVLVDEHINLQQMITATEKEYRDIELFNASVKPTNDSILEARQKNIEMVNELNSLVENRQSLSQQVNDLTILQRSIKDLVSYKIESEIKVFETYINSYLTELSNGKFALSFELLESKLTVIIYNNGIITSINTLSSGESTLVNLSTLFAIRKIMLATNPLDLLFLDEVVSVLRASDKDNLVSVLLKQDWNTLLVSHDYNNPECKTIYIEKENDISRIIR